VHRLNGRRHLHEAPPYPALLADLEAEKLTEFGRQYLDDTRIHRQQAPWFIDKMPNNFRHLRLIHLMLPNARIIDARRHPLDCCISTYKHLFAEGQEFSYSLENIGRCCAGCVDLMAHWRKLLPDAILQVDYEHVVDDLEGQVRRMLDFLQLPFDPACVEFHKTRRSVRTASSEQVRQPIKKESAAVASLCRLVGPAQAGAGHAHASGLIERSYSSHTGPKSTQRKLHPAIDKAAVDANRRQYIVGKIAKKIVRRIGQVWHIVKQVARTQHQIHAIAQTTPEFNIKRGFRPEALAGKTEHAHSAAVKAQSHQSLPVGIAPVVVDDQLMLRHRGCKHDLWQHALLSGCCSRHGFCRSSSDQLSQATALLSLNIGSMPLRLADNGGNRSNSMVCSPVC